MGGGQRHCRWGLGAVCQDHHNRPLTRAEPRTRLVGQLLLNGEFVDLEIFVGADTAVTLQPWQQQPASAGAVIKIAGVAEMPPIPHIVLAGGEKTHDPGSSDGCAC